MKKFIIFITGLLFLLLSKNISAKSCYSQRKNVIFSDLLSPASITTTFEENYEDNSEKLCYLTIGMLESKKDLFLKNWIPLFFPKERQNERENEKQHDILKEITNLKLSTSSMRQKNDLTNYLIQLRRQSSKSFGDSIENLLEKIALKKIEQISKHAALKNKLENIAYTNDIELYKREINLLKESWINFSDATQNNTNIKDAANTLIILSQQQQLKDPYSIKSIVTMKAAGEILLTIPAPPYIDKLKLFIQNFEICLKEISQNLFYLDKITNNPSVDDKIMFMEAIKNYEMYMDNPENQELLDEEDINPYENIIHYGLKRDLFSFSDLLQKVNISDLLTDKLLKIYQKKILADSQYLIHLRLILDKCTNNELINSYSKSNSKILVTYKIKEYIKKLNDLVKISKTRNIKLDNLIINNPFTALNSSEILIYLDDNILNSIYLKQPILTFRLIHKKFEKYPMYINGIYFNFLINKLSEIYSKSTPESNIIFFQLLELLELIHKKSNNFKFKIEKILFEINYNFSVNKEKIDIWIEKGLKSEIKTYQKIAELRKSKDSYKNKVDKIKKQNVGNSA